MSTDAHALLDEAAGLTEALVHALERDAATPDEILSTLQHRERLLRALCSGHTPSPRERAAALALASLDTRLMQALHDRHRAVASLLANARKRQAPPTSPRLVEESA